MSKKNDSLQSTSEQKKTWNFKKGDVSVDLTLRVDIKQQLKDCIEIYKFAITKLEEELANVK